MEDDKKCDQIDYTGPTSTDIKVQLVISLALGLSAFVAFCLLRPRWKSLYAARKQQVDPAAGLPSLPDTIFGWMPVLYRVTEREVLASAGLDAYVFLAFFKMAIKLFSVMFFFAAAVLEPINRAYAPSKSSINTTVSWHALDQSGEQNRGYLWAYLVFAYFFTALVMYVMNTETFKVIRVRQDYLGSQSTITDRTFRLSGIPKELRTEEQIKDLVERLEIGYVRKVSLCRNWKPLDDLVAERHAMLRRLEATWVDYLAQNSRPSAPVRLTVGSGDVEDGEEVGECSRLLGRRSESEDARLQARVWYGLFNMQNRKPDALDHYEAELRRLDDRILAARKKTYDPVDLAFVTMDSTAACQMAIQALLDPSPGQLLTRPAPSPSDVVWRNTYASWASRRARTWLITVFVGFLSVVWLIPVAFLASILSLCTIRKIFPGFATMLSEHEVSKALVQTGLPTAVVSLLNIAVPYLYDWLSYKQGMLSQGDIALSVISKNFFFTFFNIFLVFTLFGTASGIIAAVLDSLKDTTHVAYELARKIQELSVFYLNFIMLQGLGLFPFRLLEFGSVVLYPFYRLAARTPRDLADMLAPPLFNYGFYLPTALLVFILCLTYSALNDGYLVLFLGIVYFTLGYFTFKYQLLYAMDQPQHATGGAWRMICYRIILGLAVFQLTMSGVLALNKAFTAAVLVVPLLLATLWYSYSYKRRFEPLTRFISLRSIRRGGEVVAGDIAPVDDDLFEEEDDDYDDGQDLEVGTRGGVERVRRRSTIDEWREKGLSFVNPSLVMALEQPWIHSHSPPAYWKRGPNESENEASSAGRQGESSSQSFPGLSVHDASNDSVASSVSLGDAHIWREAEAEARG